jgi:hypothetical protein
MRHPRRRRQVPGWALILLRPAFRYSYSRDAYILRIIGRQVGPALIERRNRCHVDGR